MVDVVFPREMVDPALSGALQVGDLRWLTRLCEHVGDPNLFPPDVVEVFESNGVEAQRRLTRAVSANTRQQKYRDAIALEQRFWCTFVAHNPFTGINASVFSIDYQPDDTSIVYVDMFGNNPLLGAVMSPGKAYLMRSGDVIGRVPLIGKEGLAPFRRYRRKNQIFLGGLAIIGLVALLMLWWTGDLSSNPYAPTVP